MRGRISGAAALAFFALGGSALAAKPAKVTCGQVITTSTTLANDLTGCPADGIVIGADNITLDLNGHVVTGDGSGENDVGIANAAGHDGVTITGGSVRAFAEGVLIAGARDNEVRDIATSGQGHAGIFVDSSSRIEVAGNRVAANGAGIVVSRSDHVDVLGNNVSGTAFGGIPVFSSHDVRIAGNVVSRTTEPGVLLLDDSDANRVEDNDISRAPDGIHVFAGGDGNVISGNHVHATGGGIILEQADANTITANHVDHNAFVGIGADGGDDNLIAQNLVVANGDGSEAGIHLLSTDPTAPAERNAITGNGVSGNLGDGILVEDTLLQTLIAGNRTKNNSDDGIDVDGSSATLTANAADANGDLGIEAAPGVVDGGANTARGNGNPLQCVNVACS
jgi:parallel beta-helix repeat protein